MPEHPTNLTFGSVWEEKDRCVLLLLWGQIICIVEEMSKTKIQL